MWQDKNAGWAWYQLEGCGVTEVYRCARLGKCGAP
jgi:hypothetical protein